MEVVMCQKTINATLDDEYRKVKIIAGAGSSGSENSGGSESDDTLESKAYMSVLDLLGEGQIGGLVNNSPTSIFLNDTPLMNKAGQYNFNEVTWAILTGSQAQEALGEGFDNAEFVQTMSQIIKNDTPVTFNITDPNATQVRVVVATPALISTDNKGNIGGTSVQYNFALSLNAGAFEDVGSGRISGKTRSRYQREYVYDLPKFTSTGAKVTAWTVRISRTSPDSASSSIQNDLYLDNYSVVVGSRLSYPNSAIVGVSLNSEQFSSAPSRSYLVDGLLIKVPSNYDYKTRTYTGVWDGTFVLAPSDNPAWVLYDILTNARYGVGSFIDPSLANPARLYAIGRYCDELVDDGFGGKEPRFTINTCINSRADAYQVISDISSVFNGMTYWTGGSLGYMADMPTEVSMAYTPANVIDGAFEYSGASRKDMHSVALVTWNDPERDYQTSVEYVEDQELIERLGVRKSEITSFGCTSRGQAHRVGQWLLYTERYQSKIISFKVGIDSAFVLPGDVIKIVDPSRAGKRLGGRLLSVTANYAILDADIDSTETGATISMRLPDGAFAERLISSIGTEVGTGKQIINWETSLTQLPLVNAIWTISSPNLEPQIARVVSVGQSDNVGEFSITAIPHNPSKFDHIEKNLILETPKTSVISPSLVDPTASVSVVEETRIEQGIAVRDMSISWVQVPNAVSYEVKYRKGEGNWLSLPKTKGLSIDVPNIYQGEYQAQVIAVSVTGSKSRATYSNLTLLQGQASTLPKLAIFEVTPAQFGVKLNWEYGANTAGVAYTEIYSSLDGTTFTLLGTFPDPIKNHAISGLYVASKLWFKARIADTYGNFGVWSDVISASPDISPDKVLDVLSDSIGAAQLSPAVNDKMQNTLATAEKAVIDAAAASQEVKDEAAARASAIVAANTTISTAIAKEVTDRNTAIVAKAGEITTATDTKLATEATARTAEIVSKVNSEAATRASAITAAVTKEITDRNAAITTETTARVAAITKEVTDRNTAITAKASEITATTDTKIAAEAAARSQEIATNIAAEATARSQEIATNIAAEVTARTSAITTAITQEVTDRTTAIGVETTARVTAISKEVTDRNAAIGVEATARAAAITKEVTDRNTAIGVETTARTAAIAKEVTDRNAAIAVETTARVAAVSAEATARTQEITTKVAAAQATVQANIDTVSNGLTQEITDRQSGDTAVVGQLNAYKLSNDTAVAAVLDKAETAISNDAATASKVTALESTVSTNDATVKGLITNVQDSVTTLEGNTNTSLTNLSSDISNINLRGQDLVSNGLGQLMSNKYWGTTTFTAMDKPAGAGSFLSALGSGIVVGDEFIAVDPARAYKFSLYLRQTVAGIAARAFSMITPYDVDKNSIMPYHYMAQPNTLTTLAAPLKKGDTTMTLTNTANWYNAVNTNTWLRSAIFWNYTDATGYKWPANTYSRNFSSDLYDGGAISGNVITLKRAWAGADIPAGTEVSNGNSGSNYMYMGAINTVIPQAWTAYSGQFEGVHTNNAFAASNMLPMMTSYVKIGFLVNRTDTGTNNPSSRMAFGGISLRDWSVAKDPALASSSALTALDTKVTTIDGKVTTNASSITSLTGRMTTVEGKAQQGIDAAATAQTTANTGVTQSNANASALTVLDTKFTTKDSEVRGLIASETNSRATADTAVNTRIDTLTSTVTTKDSEVRGLITSEQSARASADTALTTRIDALTASTTTDISNANAAVTAEQTARTSADTALGQRIDTVIATATADKTSLTALVTTETTARTDADSALTSRIDALVTSTTSDKGTLQAAITAEETARTTADTALSGRVDTVEASLNTAEADIATKANATALDSTNTEVSRINGVVVSQGTSITTLNSNLTTTNTNVTAAQNAANAANTLAGGKGKVLYQSTVPATADRLSQNLWIDTTSGANTPKRWNGTAWVAVTDKVATDAAAAAANALSVANTKADTTALNSLTTRVTNAEGTITSQGTSITQLTNNLATTNTNVSNKAETSALNTLDSKVTGIDGKVTTNATAITALQNRATTIEGNVAQKLDASAITNYYTKTQADTATAGQINAYKAALVIGGTNLFGLKELMSYAGGNLSSNNTGFMSVDGSTINVVGQGIASNLPGNLIPVDYTKDIIVSWYPLGDYTGHQIYYVTQDAQGAVVVGQRSKGATKGADGRVVITIPKSELSSAVTHLRLGLGATSLSTYSFKDIQVEQGTVVTNWSPSPRDYTANFAGLASSYTANANAINATNTEVSRIDGVVVSQGTSISQLQSDLATVDAKTNTAITNAATAQTTANTAVTNDAATASRVSTLESAMNTAEADIATKATATALNATNTEVSRINGVVVTQGTSITSLNNSLATTNSNVSKALAAVTVADTRNDNQPPSWYWANYSKRIVNEFKAATAIDVTGLSWYVNLETRVYYSDASGGAILQTAYSVADPLLQMVRRSSGTGTSAVWTAWAQPLKTMNDTINTKASTTALNALDSKVTSIDGRVTANASSISTLQANLTETNNLLGTVNTATATAQDTANSAVTGNEATATSLNTLKSTYEAKVAAMDTTIAANATSAASDLNTAQTTLTNADTALGARIDTVSATMTSDKTEVVGLITDVANSVTTLDGNTNTKISALQSSLDATNTNVATKADASALNGLTTRVTSAEGTISSQGTSITTLNNSLATTNTNVTAAQNAANAANTLAGSKGKVLVQTTTPAVADCLAQNLWIDITGNANTPKRWNGTAWVVVTDKVATDAAAAAANALSVANTKADATALTSLTTRVTNAEGVNTTQGTAITNLQNSLTTTNNTVSTKADATALNTLDSKVTTIDGKVATNTSNITSLTGRVTTVEGTVATKADSSAVTALTNRVTTVEGGLTTQATNTTNLQAALNITDAKATAALPRVQTAGTYKTFKGVLAYYASSASIAGNIVIQTPITFTGKMFHVSGKGYNYTKDKSIIDFNVSGYAYTSTSLLQHGSSNLGTLPLRIRLGIKDSKVCIILTSPNWSYPQFELSAEIGYTLPPDSWKDGWTASVINEVDLATQGITSIIEPSVLDVGANLQANSTAINTTNTEVSRINGVVTAQGSSISQLQSNLTATDTKANTALANAATAQGTANTAVTNNAATASRVDTLESEMTTVQDALLTKADASAVNTLDTKVTTIDGKVTTNANAITTLQNRATTIEGNVSTKADATALDALTTRVTSAEGVNTSQGTAITTLTNDLATANTAIGTKASTTALNALDSKVTTVDGKVTTNTSNITSLTGRVTTVEGAVSTKAEASALNNYYTKTQSDASATTIAAGKVDAFNAGLILGGSNLYYGENPVALNGQTGAGTWTAATDRTTAQLFMYLGDKLDIDSLVINDDTVASIEVLIPSTNTADFNFNFGSYRFSSSVYLTTALLNTANFARDKWVKVSAPAGKFLSTAVTSGASINVVFNLSGTILAGSTLKWRNLMMEKATKASAFSEADKSVQTKLNANSTSISNTNTEVSRINGVVVAQGSSISTLQSNLAATDTKAGTAITNAATAQTTANTGVTKADAAASAVNTLQTAYEAKIALLDTADANNAANIVSTNTALTNAQTALSNADTALGSSIDALTTTVANNDTSVRGAIQDVADSVTTLEGNTNTHFTSLESSLAGLTTTVGTKADASALNSLTTRVTNAEGVNTTQGTAITNLQNSLTTTNNTVATKADTSALNALDSKVTVIDGKVTTNTSNITSLTGRMTTVEGNVATKADATALTALTTRVTNAEGVNTSQATSITTLNSSLTKLDELARVMNSGKLLFTDPTFKQGNNNVVVYNNLVNGNVTITRRAKSTDNPTTSGYELAVKSVGTASPVWGGILLQANARPNAVFLTKYIAKLATGYWFTPAANAMGNGATDKLYGPTSGTDKFETFYRVTRCGPDGSFSNFGHLYVGGSPTPTVDAPLEWVLASIEMYDCADFQDAPQSVLNAIASAQTTANTAVTNGQANATAITNLNTALNSLDTEVNGRIDTVSASVTTLEGNTNTHFTSLESSLATVDGKASTGIANAASAQTTANTAVTNAATNASNITSLQGRMTTVEGAVSTKADATALTTLTTRVTNVEGVNTTQGTAITNLQNSLTTANNAIATKADTTALNALDSKVTVIDGKVTTNATAITSLQSNLATTDGKANTAIANAAAAQTTANTAVTANQATASNLSKLESTFSAGASGESLIPDYLMADVNSWRSHYGIDLTSYFKTVTDGKIGPNVFRKEASVSTCWNYSRYALPNTRKYKLSMWVRRQIGSAGSIYFTVNTIGIDGIHDTTYSSVTKTVAANETWVYVEHVIDYTGSQDTIAQLAFGFALNHSASGYWCEMQGFKVQAVLSDSDVDATKLATKATLDSVQTTLANADTALSSRIDTLTTTVSTNDTTVKGQIQDLSDSVTTANSNTTTKLSQLESGLTAANSAISTKAEQSALNTTNSTLNTVSGKVETQATSINALNSKTTTLTNDLDSTSRLARAIASGKLMFEDPTFKVGTNSVAKYDGAQSEYSIARVVKQPANPTTSAYEMKITVTNEATIRLGGFYQLINSRANGMFVVKYIICLPVGLKLVPAANAMGTGAVDQFIGNVEGTGQYETYYRLIKCGPGGTFSTTGFVYAMRSTGSALPTATALSPIEWYVASIESYDAMDFDDMTPALRTTVADIQSKVSTLTTDTTAAAERFDLMSAYVNYPETADSGALTTDNTTTSATRWTVHSMLVEGDRANATAIEQMKTEVDGTIAQWSQTINSEVIAGLSATTEQVTALTSELNGQKTQVNTIASTVNGVVGKYAVNIDSNGVMSGFQLISEGGNGQAVSTFGVDADNFYIGSPATGKRPFIVTTTPRVIDGVTYPPGTWIDSAYIADASIQMAHIDKASINSLSAISATIGTLRTATTGARTEITDNLIKVYDENDVLRVRIGVWS